MPNEKKPSQPVLPEEETAPKEPSVIRRILTRIGAVILLIAALVFAYIFLLMGEPEEDMKNGSPAPEAVITMPMSPFEAPGEANVDSLAETFGQPVLSIYQGAEMRKARIYDTAFEGGYARCVTLTYTLEDGTQFTVESIRPTSAVSLINQSGYKLDATALYALGGLNAARMENDVNICVFAQSDAAVYAVTCPKTHEEELEALLRQTMLTEPQTDTEDK